MFSTAVDNQTNVEIDILQGERELVADNKSTAENNTEVIYLSIFIISLSLLNMLVNINYKSVSTNIKNTW